MYIIYRLYNTVYVRLNRIDFTKSCRSPYCTRLSEGIFPVHHDPSLHKFLKCSRRWYLVSRSPVSILNAFFTKSSSSRLSFTRSFRSAKSEAFSLTRGAVVDSTKNPIKPHSIILWWSKILSQTRVNEFSAYKICFMILTRSNLNFIFDLLLIRMSLYTAMMPLS